MKRIASWLAWPLLAFFLMIWADNAQAQILMDDFEAGTADAQIPNTGPWRVNDSGPVAEGLTARYRTANNPFSSGSVYAHLNDPQAAAGYGYRLMSTNAADTGGLAAQIGGQVTTFSFEFWETAADIPTGTNPGMGVGYYNPQATGTGIDLNNAGRNFRVFLHNGMLSPDTLVPDSGAAVAYARETVHTVFMVTNDSAAAVANYQDGQTLDPGQSDVWISLAGANPILAFTVSDPNPGFNPWGVGFRSFTNDIEEFYINNVLLVSGATLDRGPFTVVPQVPGDVDGDGIGGEFPDDFDPIRTNFRKSVVSRSQGDLVTNNFVDFEDFREWKSAFLSGGGSLADIDLGFVMSVPEPGTLVLLLPAFAALLGSCRTRRAADRNLN